MKENKEKKEKNVSAESAVNELPQNIMPVGERVMENKNIYILQKAYAQIHKFASDKTENEYGGILVGRVFNEMGKENTIIEGFIEARYNDATPTTLTFTHETWEYFYKEIDKRFSGKKIVGWIHTHPNFGIFLSENDKFIQENFFTDTNQVAYVVDPIQESEGFFFWVDGKLEQCPGFYVYDKVGKKIRQKPWENDTEAEGGNTIVVKKGISPVWIAVLVILLIGNMIISVFQYDKISVLEKKIEDQEFVLKYGMFGADVSVIADSIRMKIAEQEKLQKEAEKSKKEAPTNGGAEAEAENAEQPTTAEGNDENEASKENTEASETAQSNDGAQ